MYNNNSAAAFLKLSTEKLGYLSCLHKEESLKIFFFNFNFDSNPCIDFFFVLFCKEQDVSIAGVKTSAVGVIGPTSYFVTSSFIDK